MLSVQKYLLEKIGLGIADRISVSETHSTNFVSSFEPFKSEIVKPVEVTPSLKEIRVDLKESKPKNPTFPKDTLQDRPL